MCPVWLRLSSSLATNVIPDSTKLTMKNGIGNKKTQLAASRRNTGRTAIENLPTELQKRDSLAWKLKIEMNPASRRLEPPGRAGQLKLPRLNQPRVLLRGG